MTQASQRPGFEVCRGDLSEQVLEFIQQAVRCGSLLQEELEDLRATKAAPEEQRTVVVAQNKQLDLCIEKLKSNLNGMQEHYSGRQL
ncbi:hypothetical protein APTSU1_000665400 [Apodemus speciosus]|uniref:Uncharacterized protein n=1 Tax=Apodemus speciosus TaxID=105296 RepID=A0ABQ0EWL2_APOSI